MEAENEPDGDSLGQGKVKTLNCVDVSMCPVPTRKWHRHFFGRGATVIHKKGALVPLPTEEEEEEGVDPGEGGSIGYSVTVVKTLNPKP